MFRKSTHGSKFCPRRVASATAAALVFALASAGTVTAQPAGMMAGPHGGHGIEQLIADAKTRLGLNTSQQAMFDNAVAQTKAARDAGRTVRQRLHDAMKAEAAKGEPDLAALGTIADDAEQQGRAMRRQVRDEWLKLYATFTAEQKAVVRDIMQQRIARVDSFRQRMLEHFHGG